MNKQNNQRATYREGTMMKNTLYHVESLQVSLP